MKSKYDEIRDIILRIIPDVGNYPTSINGVRIVRRNNPTEFLRCFYNPSCILVLQGLKHMLYGNENIIYGKGQYVELATCISYTGSDGDVINSEHDAIGNKALAFVGTSGVQLGWLASQADMLADDWRIVE